MLKQLLLWHRRIALFCLVPFIVWALSGLLHPIMSHFAKAPRINATPTQINVQYLQNYAHLKDLLSQKQIERFSHASLVSYKGAYYYQVRELKLNHIAMHYLPLRPHLPILTDEQYAQYLAHKWSHQTISNSKLITQFSTAYPEINRVLPVYRFTLENGNRVYIDTLGKRITAHNTVLRESLSYWFKQLHTWQFVGDRHSPWRIVPMLLISATLFIVAILGLIAYSMLWRRIKSSRLTKQAMHRSLGLVLSVCLLGFASSSMHILIDKFYPQSFRQIIPDNTLMTRALDHDPIKAMQLSKGQNFQLVAIDGEIYSQIPLSEKGATQFSYWQDTRTSKTDLQLVQQILNEQLNISGTVQHFEQIDRFGPTYGFINKRLPVIQLRFAEQPNHLYSVEPHTGYVAAIEDTWQSARNWHFGNLHKYHFLNPIGKGLRDSIVAIICLGLVFVAILGTSLYFARAIRQYRIKKQRASHHKELLKITKEQAE
ncbi:PepSY domain-containing protein [Pseudoalteromonas sp. SMS1]|uniref:PepSY domain-containing protein n=1 Tax=Pseudoalteromonas sp. SMS1 TaxID=2908894 RepID=UPI001F1AE67E|nr:PepSY domain-containing protein [Pseudoalteromonas sp. SMS1]MCF2859974.1 PepSY domain-containing protein [Pseudoalteromonas sp. SMS1]